MKALLIISAVFSVVSALPLDPTPPMGWMSWEIFRCDIDCAHNSTDCINEYLYKTMADELVAGGYLDAGYDGVHIDDCWMQKDPPRVDGRLVPDPTRFPSGFSALAEYVHSKNVRFGVYTAESPTTCAGYPASATHEAVDAESFASWDVDYVKVDGCGDQQYYPTGYPAMGKALAASGRNITYSCSWPAYLGSNETAKPFDEFIAAGCNLWRNWDDIQCSWSSLVSIIDHWGDYAATLQKYAAPNHFNDPDMLLIGNTCINDDEARTQMAMWSIFAAPLIMGNDLRTVSASARAILLNKDAIKVNQDPKGMQGARITAKGPQEVWARNLSSNDVAVALFNKEGSMPSPTPQPCPAPEWNVTSGGYIEACGGAAGNIGSFNGLSLSDAKLKCCNTLDCAGFSFNPTDGSGYFKDNLNCGVVHNSDYNGYNKPNFPREGGSADITVHFSQLHLPVSAAVNVYDIWAQKSLGTFTDSFTASVPFHGTAFLRLSVAA